MNPTRLVNCTPHAITLIRPEGRVTVPPSGMLARAAMERAVVEEVAVVGGDGAPLTVPVHRVTYGALDGLPAPRAGTLYIVSALAAQAALALGRNDVVIVDLAVRDGEGRIIGAEALARV
jgi:hypothetical protein